MRTRIPYAERDGRMVGPLDVPNGLACGCSCPVCGARLIAYQHGQKIAHFGHEKGTTCAGAAETALHRMAKEIVARATRFAVPPWPIRDSHSIADGRVGHGAFVIPGDTIYPSDGDSEDARDGLRPDVVLNMKSGELWVEIAVHHRVEENKRREMADRGIFCVEIDLQDWPLEHRYEDLVEVLTTGTDRKRVLSHPDEALARSETRRRAERNAEPSRLVQQQRPVQADPPPTRIATAQTHQRQRPGYGLKRNRQAALGALQTLEAGGTIALPHRPRQWDQGIESRLAPRPAGPWQVEDVDIEPDIDVPGVDALLFGPEGRLWIILRGAVPEPEPPFPDALRDRLEVIVEIALPPPQPGAPDLREPVLRDPWTKRWHPPVRAIDLP